MAKESGWGYRRIFGELKKLGINFISRSTISRILIENGFDPGPIRGKGTWHDFVQRHIKTLWATDFFTKTVMTLRGPVTYYVLFFIHLQSCRVHLAGVTPNPVMIGASLYLGEIRPGPRPTTVTLADSTDLARRGRKQLPWAHREPADALLCRRPRRLR